MLGQSKINMVLRYAPPTQERQTKAMDKLELWVSPQKIAEAEGKATQTSYDSGGPEQCGNTEKRGPRCNVRSIKSVRAGSVEPSQVVEIVGAPDGI